jgi:putative FmdB family regulatory protein
MPTYRYRCAKCGEELEVWQSFDEKPKTRHAGGCGGKLTKVLSPAGIVLKGSGFYKTDNRASAKAKSGAAESGSGSSSESGSSGSSSESGSSGGSSGGSSDSGGSGTAGTSGTQKSGTKNSGTKAGSSSSSS